MEIIDKAGTVSKFRNIPVGCTFVQNDAVYMVVRPVGCEMIGYNAVCMQSGKLHEFGDNAEVVPCIMRAEIITKGAYK
jgi:hypothetical protein